MVREVYGSGEELWSTWSCRRKMEDGGWRWAENRCSRSGTCPGSATCCSVLQVSTEEEINSHVALLTYNQVCWGEKKVIYDKSQLLDIDKRKRRSRSFIDTVEKVLLPRVLNQLVWLTQRKREPIANMILNDSSSCRFLRIKKILSLISQNSDNFSKAWKLGYLQGSCSRVPSPPPTDHCCHRLDGRLNQAQPTAAQVVDIQTKTRKHTQENSDVSMKRFGIEKRKKMLQRRIKWLHSVYSDNKRSKQYNINNAVIPDVSPGGGSTYTLLHFSFDY